MSAAPVVAGPRPRLKQRYIDEVRVQLKEELGLANIMQVPRLEKIVVVGLAAAQLIAVIGDIGRFRNYAEFRAYLGWSPQVERSGSSLDSSKLAKSGVRLSRKVLGQMVMIMLAPGIRTTPFRAYYERLTARGMRPAKAVGHVAGKLSAVLYSMLKTMAPYDEAKHRKELGFRKRLTSLLKRRLMRRWTSSARWMRTWSPSKPAPRIFRTSSAFE